MDNFQPNLWLRLYLEKMCFGIKVRDIYDDADRDVARNFDWEAIKHKNHGKNLSMKIEADWGGGGHDPLASPMDA